MGLVLVIDDDADTRRLLERMLGRWGHRAVATDSGESGLALVAKEKPDLVIVDGMMHGMNGVEFIRLLRAEERTALVPVVLYTCIDDHTFRENAIEKGASEIWIKTKVTMDQIHQRVETYFSTDRK